MASETVFLCLEVGPSPSELASHLFEASDLLLEPMPGPMKASKKHSQVQHRRASAGAGALCALTFTPATSHSLDLTNAIFWDRMKAARHDHFLKLPKAERQAPTALSSEISLEAKVKILTQRILSGETSAPSGLSRQKASLSLLGDEEASPGQQRRIIGVSKLIWIGFRRH